MIMTIIFAAVCRFKSAAPIAAPRGPPMAAPFAVFAKVEMVFKDLI